MGSFSWIEYLKDPQLVANFQQYFGVRAPIYYNSSKTCNRHEDFDDHPKLDIDVDDDDPWTKKTTAKDSAVFPATSRNLSTRGSSKSSVPPSPYISNHSKEYSKSEANQPCPHCQHVKSGCCDEDDAQFDEKEQKEKDMANNIIGNKFWYLLFSFGTALGDEAFYAFSFCFWFWNVDGSVGRRVVYVWAILMYIGQGLKDIIKWPRPSCPPVVRLARKWELEYGMPSTHAIVGSAVPFSIIFFTSARYQYPVAIGLIGVFIAISWCALVSLSRIYLGMHSVLDIIAGLSIVAVGINFVMPLVDWFDPILLQHEYGSLVLWFCAILLIICSPGGDRWTPARGDTVVILGSCVGLNTGAWLNYQSGIIRGPALDPPYPVIWPSYGMIGLSFMRIVIGLCFIAAIRASIKSFARFTIQRFILSKDQLSKATVTRKQVVTELTYKFLTYTILGFATVYIVPSIFRFMGIERPTFHTEV